MVTSQPFRSATVDILQIHLYNDLECKMDLLLTYSQVIYWNPNILLEENEGLIYLLLPFTYCLKKNGCISGNVLGRCSLSSVQLTPPEDASSKTVGALQYLEEVTL